MHYSFQLLLLCFMPAWQIPAPDITDDRMYIIPSLKDVLMVNNLRDCFSFNPYSLLYTSFYNVAQTDINYNRHEATFDIIS